MVEYYNLSSDTFVYISFVIQNILFAWLSCIGSLDIFYPQKIGYRFTRLRFSYLFHLLNLRFGSTISLENRYCTEKSELHLKLSIFMLHFIPGV